MNAFESNLKRLRSNQNMKQEELAERMNVTRQTISGWETGRRQPDLETLKKLAEVLDVDIHELIYGNKPGEYPKFQKKYVIITAVCGVVVVLLLLFWLLSWPRLKIICATFHWGMLLSICYDFLPQVGAFACGALIPSMIQLFVPIRKKKLWSLCCLICGMMMLIPNILFWMKISYLRIWFIYPIGSVLLSFIFPWMSGICTVLGTTGEVVT